MAQEIVRLCDPCLVEDGARVAGAGLTVDIGAGPIAVDVCESHYARLIKPLADVLDLYGVAEGKGAKSRKRRKGAGWPARVVETPAEVAPAEEWPGGRVNACPWCEYAVDSSSMFRRHLLAAHEVAGLSAWLGNTCPLCGENHPARGLDSMAGHVEAVHGLPSVSRAVVAAREAGDPHGVYAALLAAVAGA